MHVNPNASRFLLFESDNKTIRECKHHCAQQHSARISDIYNFAIKTIKQWQKKNSMFNYKKKN